VNDEAQPLRPDPHDPQPEPYSTDPGADRIASGTLARGAVAPGPFVATPAGEAGSGGQAAPVASAPDESRPFYRRRRVQLVAALLAVLALGFMMAQRASRPASPVDPAQQTPLVSVIVPGKTATTSAVTFTGAISARYDMPIGVEDSGRIAAVLVEAGDRVRAGQLLARLDTSVVASQVASLSAQLEQARAEAVLAAQELKRAEQIVESVAALSQSEVDRRRAEVQTRNARVRAAEAQLAESRARQGRTEVRAPSDGIVLTRTAEVGQTATPGGAPLFRLGRGGEVEMRGQVSEQDLPKLRLGQSARVRITGVTEPFEGQVRLLAAVIDPQTRLGEIRVALTPHPDLRPGAFARGEVVTEREQRPVLPQTAVMSDGTQNYVLIAGEGDKVARRNVRIASTGPRGVVIAAGLTGTERVITTAGPFLREGEVVRVSEAGAATTPAAAPAKPAATAG
jgi:RND family efflux transporter MFP subunit